MRITLKDVAEKAGVAKSTVSFVLNNSKPVAAKTRKRILETIKELEYSPCEIATRLGKRQFTSVATRRLAFISCNIDSSKNAYFSRILNGATNEARKQSYSISYAYIRDYDEYPADIAGVNHVSGVIFTGRPTRKQIEYLTGLNIPFVLADYYIEDLECSWVRPDNQRGMYDTVEYLFNLGHRKILFTNGNGGHPDFIEKEKYFKLAAEKFGIKYNILKENVLRENNMDPAILGNELKKIKATAIMASYDFLAASIAQLLNKLGLKIPDDISLTGFDGELGGTLMTPPLTTVAVDLESIGQVSTKILIDMLEEKSSVSTSRIPAKLIVRESCRILNTQKSKAKAAVSRN